MQSLVYIILFNIYFCTTGTDHMQRHPSILLSRHIELMRLKCLFSVSKMFLNFRNKTKCCPPNKGWGWGENKKSMIALRPKTCAAKSQSILHLVFFYLYGGNEDQSKLQLRLFPKESPRNNGETPCRWWVTLGFWVNISCQLFMGACFVAENVNRSLDPQPGELKQYCNVCVPQRKQMTCSMLLICCKYMCKSGLSPILLLGSLQKLFTRLPKSL